MKDSIISIISNLDSNLIASISAFFSSISAFSAIVAFIMSAKSNEIKLLGLPLIYFREIEVEGRKKTILRIRNVGESTIVNIKFESYRILFRDADMDWNIHFKIPETNALIPNEERIIDVDTSNSGLKTSLEELIVSFMQSGNVGDIGFILTIHYQNILGKNYFLKIKTSDKGVEVLKTAKSLNLWNRYVLFCEYIFEDLPSIASHKIIWFFKRIWKN